MTRIIFVTGTDTGVGKTLLSSLLLVHLRRTGCHALAMKPFCTGSRKDVEFLHHAMDGEMDPDEINPFYFRQPLAPLVAGGKSRREVAMRAVIELIWRRAALCEYLLIEGVGGLLTPLGEEVHGGRPDS